MRARRRKWAAVPASARRALMHDLRHEVETRARMSAMHGVELTTCPVWLVAGASVIVRRALGAGTHTLTVQSVEWPWCVYFYELPGATHPANIVSLADERK